MPDTPLTDKELCAMFRSEFLARSSMKNKLVSALECISKTLPGFQYRVCTDSKNVVTGKFLLMSSLPDTVLWLLATAYITASIPHVSTHAKTLIPVASLFVGAVWTTQHQGDLLETLSDVLFFDSTHIRLPGDTPFFQASFFLEGGKRCERECERGR